MTDALLWNQQCISLHAFLDVLAHEHARQQKAFQIGKNGSQCDRSSALVHCDFGELERAFLAIVTAVFETKVHGRLTGDILLQRSGGRLALETDKGAAWLGDV